MKEGILRWIVVVGGTFAILAIIVYIGSRPNEAERLGEEAGRDGSACTERNARYYLGGAPSKGEIDDFILACFTAE